VLVATGGLIVTAHLRPIAKDFNIADVPVSLMGITLPALTFALSLDRVLNGLSRPTFGWVSDQIGRENTMFCAFLFEAVAVLLFAQYGQNPVLFVLLIAAIYLGWGEIYSLFPATCGDSFGRRFASANYGLLYTAKGTASLLVPLSSMISGPTGAWRPIFFTASAMSVVAAVMALVVLKPLRARTAAARVQPPAFGKPA
jgi:OFA family oxalate/formate antiporter-like MFS transporter